VNPRGVDRWRSLKPISLAARFGWLFTVVAIVYAPMALVAGYTSGSMGVWAASIATLICLGAASAALLVTEVFRSPETMLAGMLVGMLARMGVPLVFCLALSLRRGPLVDAGVITYLLIIYMPILAVETWMATGLSAMPIGGDREASSRAGKV